MKYFSLAILIIISFFAHSQRQVALIPYPEHIQSDSGFHDLEKLSFFYTNLEEPFLTDELNRFSRSYSTAVRISYELQNSGLEAIQDTLLLDSLGAEGYVIKITSRKISIKAATRQGIFYGLQSIKQLAAFHKQIPCMTILDRPRFTWRGSMIDLARSFYGAEYLKKHIDRMALYKMNRLHLHLTDDQGWRIEIKSWPKLTSHGSRSAVEGGNAGYMTQSEYLDLQEYAHLRNVVIIPEIDMPGHVYAALASYDELNCVDQKNINLDIQSPPDLYGGTEVGWNKLCLSNPRVYQFTGEVMRELAGITKGPYLHLGGDEIEDSLYEQFVEKADSIVRGLNKIPVGWEEVLKGEVSSELIGQFWHESLPDTVNNLWIMSLCSHFYLDHPNYSGQPHTQDWCTESIDLSDAYFDAPDHPKLMGVEAAIWTEFVHDEDKMDNLLWPRLCATSEIGWSIQTDFESFKNRLAFHADLFESMNIQYHRFESVTWK